MGLSRFTKLCRKVARNAAGYKTKLACRLWVQRLRALWYKGGSYGCVHGELTAAVHALQDRWLELDGIERDARWAQQEKQSCV